MIGRWRLLLVVAVIAGCAMIVVTAQQPPPADGPAPVQGASYTVQQAERGRVAYASNCSGCHGPNLDDGPSDAPPVTGVNFVTFWGTRSVGDCSTTSWTACRRPPRGRLAMKRLSTWSPTSSREWALQQAPAN